VLAWIIAALNIAGLVTPVVGLLDAMAVPVGNFRVSLLLVLKGAVTLAIFVWIANTLSRLIDQRLRVFGPLTPAVQVLAAKLVRMTLLTLAVVLALGSIGIDLTAFAVFSGAVGVGVGFGLQKVVSNLISGVILLMDRSIKPGDVIAVNDGISNTVGQVKRIGLRAVSVTTRDRKEYLIPNENLMINQVENWSYSSREVRIRVPLIIAASSDVDLAERLMLEAAASAPRVLKSPPPAAWLTAITEEGLAFEIRFWIDDPEEGLTNVRSDILKRVWHLFQQDGVELPNRAQRDLSLRDSAALRKLIAAVHADDDVPAKPRKGGS
jgi:small-conductance mechanosensitive channel